MLPLKNKSRFGNDEDGQSRFEYDVDMRVTIIYNDSSATFITFHTVWS